VSQEHNTKRPADFNKDMSFFVTDDMIQHPSDKLFRGKHELIGNNALYAFSHVQCIVIVLL
jgi:hypothetical protein